MMTTHVDMPVLMTAAHVAELTGLSENTLSNHRSVRIGIPFVKFGRNVVRYKAADVLAFIEQNTVQPLR